VCAQSPINVYAGGVSADGKNVAVTGMYARLTGDSYTFALLDILPMGIKPVTVLTSVSGGYAQKVATIGPVRFFVPTAAGLTTNGSHVGWNWTSGVLGDCPIGKSNWHLQPNVRFVKSSVSAGEGYVVIGGLWVAWGK
jgi:hypothetical protein